MRPTPTFGRIELPVPDDKGDRQQNLCGQVEPLIDVSTFQRNRDNPRNAVTGGHGKT